jgi:thiol-disulfide isomerase/thioredoxin
MKKITLFLVLVVLGFGASFAQKTVSVSGKLEGITEGNEIVVYKLAKDKIEFARGQLTENGQFNIKGELENTNVYYMTVNNKYRIDLILHPNDKVVIRADVNRFLETLNIQGSPDTKFLYELKKMVTPKYEELNKLKTEYTSTEDKTIQKDIIKKFSSIKTDLDNKMAQMLMGNSSSLACLFYIEQLEMGKYTNVYSVVSNNLNRKYPDNDFVKDFYNKVNSSKSTSIGSIAPDIHQPGPDGKKRKLSSLTGKVVLIDFWASWCGPCRRENPNVVALYEKYKDKGFEIFSVSLDKNKEKWLQAIKDDNLSWENHVSDLKYWSSHPAKSYGVTSIPATFLLDKDGRIIAKNLRGKALELKLEELFKE